MKIRVSMPGAMAVKEIEDVKAEIIFQKLLTELFETGKKEKVKAPRLKFLSHNMDAAPEEEKTEITEKLEQTVDTCQETKEVKQVDAIAEIPISGGIDGILKYKGFLYIKCSKCGSIHGFHLKDPMSFYECRDCGYKMPFDTPLALLWTNCECGKRFKYLTNRTETEFDIKCIECGAPVAVSWNSKKRIYEPMRE